MSAMPDRLPGGDQALLAARRRGAVKTALLVGSIALAIYIAFILSGVLNA